MTRHGTTNHGLNCPVCGRFVAFDADECACGEPLPDGEQGRLGNFDDVEAES